MDPVRQISFGLRINIIFWPRGFSETSDKGFKVIEQFQLRVLTDDCFQD